MRVVIVNPLHSLEDDIYGSGAKVQEHFEGLVIREVIEVREPNVQKYEFLGLSAFDLLIYYYDENNKLEVIGMRKNEFTELRVYVD